MGQIFHPSFNYIARISIYGGVLFIGGIFMAIVQLNKAPYFTEVNIPREQPVMFSHKHHVDGLGIDCRFCHTSVEESAFAGIPPTETCMKCHHIVWKDSPMLEPVRESFRTGESIEWTRVHDLPDHVYFNHSIHIKKGIACVTCHGQVDQMPLMWRVNTLHMGWCLECHKDPAPNVRPPEEVFNMNWQKPENWDEVHQELVEELGIKSKISCSVCHR